MNKKDVHQQCMAILDIRVETVQNAIRQASESATNETKSSAGSYKL